MAVELRGKTFFDTESGWMNPVEVRNHIEGLEDQLAGREKELTALYAAVINYAKESLGEESEQDYIHWFLGVYGEGK